MSRASLRLVVPSRSGAGFLSFFLAAGLAGCATPFGLALDEETAQIVVDPLGEISFGMVRLDSSASRDVRISAEGGGSVLVDELSVRGQGNDYFRFEEEYAPTRLERGDQMRLTLVFTPEVSGPARGTLTIHTTAQGGMDLTCQLVGTGCSDCQGETCVHPEAGDSGCW